MPNNATASNQRIRVGWRERQLKIRVSRHTMNLHLPQLLHCRVDLVEPFDLGSFLSGHDIGSNQGIIVHPSSIRSLTARMSGIVEFDRVKSLARQLSRKA